MENDESVGYLEGKWCVHCHVTVPTMLGLQGTHYFIIHKAPVHVVFEEQTVKVLCPACFKLGVVPPVGH